MKLINKDSYGKMININDNVLILFPLIAMLLMLVSTSAFAKYNRKDWKHWSSSGHGCRNTRSQIMFERSKTPVTFTNKKECTVKTGTWDDFYYNEVITTAKDADIDHVIPLKHANDIGGEAWSPEQKEKFANDPDNLIITNKSYNRQKGAKTIAEWLPVDRTYACRYVIKWFDLKRKYNLKISKEEVESRHLLKCP